MTPILAMLLACVTPDPPPPVPVAPPPPAPAQRIAKSKATKSKGATDGSAAPLGVAGPGTVELTVQASETATTGTIALTFADGSSRTLPIGNVPAKCSEVPPAPVTQNGREISPLYSFSCTSTKGTATGHLAQVDNQLLIVQIDPPRPGTTTPRMKVLKRFTLAAGVVLARKA